MSTDDVEFDRLINNEMRYLEISEQTPPNNRNSTLLMSIVKNSDDLLDYKASQSALDKDSNEYELVSAALEEAWKAKSYGTIRHMGEHPDSYHQWLLHTQR